MRAFVTTVQPSSAVPAMLRVCGALAAADHKGLF